MRLLHLGIHWIDGDDPVRELSRLNVWTWFEAIRPRLSHIDAFCFSNRGGSVELDEAMALHIVRGRRGEGLLGLVLLPLEMLCFARHVIKASRRDSTSIILCTDPMITGLPGIVAGRLAHVPVVLYAAGDAVEVAVWKLTSRIRATSILRGCLDRAVRVLYCCFEEVACVSQDMARTIRPSSLARMCVCRNFVADFFFKSAGPQSSVEPMVLTVSRLSPEKGLDHLIDAAARVVAVNPSTRFQIVGEGKSRNGLEREVEARGLPSNVRFIGSVANCEMPKRYQESSLLTLPSLTEGLPLCVLEALACGRAVVVTGVGGVPEVVDRNVGMVVPAGNPGMMAEAILALLSDPKKRTAMGRRGRRRIATHLSKERYVERLVGALSRAMASSDRAV